MSKHFELMQQMEAERLLNAESSSRPSIPAAPVSAVSTAILERPNDSREQSGVSSFFIEQLQTSAPIAPAISVSTPAPIPATPAPSLSVALTQPVPVLQPANKPAPPAVAEPVSSTFTPTAPQPIPATEPRRWASVEALRLAQQVFLQKSQPSPAVVVFAGIDSGNGCSEVCASVAEALAKTAGKSVCMIEANFRAPALSGLFAANNDGGLTDALRAQGAVRSFLKQVAQENLWLLSSGAIAADSPNLLTSDSLRARLQELRREFDYILIDAPPLNRHSDAVVLGRLSDGLVMVLGADSTQREAASDAATNLRSARIPILAAVLNKGNSPASQIDSTNV